MSFALMALPLLWAGAPRLFPISLAFWAGALLGTAVGLR